MCQDGWSSYTTPTALQDRPVHVHEGWQQLAAEISGSMRKAQQLSPTATLNHVAHNLYGLCVSRSKLTSHDSGLDFKELQDWQLKDGGG